MTGSRLILCSFRFGVRGNKRTKHGRRADRNRRDIAEMTRGLDWWRQVFNLPDSIWQVENLPPRNQCSRGCKAGENRSEWFDEMVCSKRSGVQAFLFSAAW